MQQVVIASAKRTPIASFQGKFASLSASTLGGFAIESAVSAAEVEPDLIEDVVMGCVLTAGQGQAPARQAGFAAGDSGKRTGNHCQ